MRNGPALVLCLLVLAPPLRADEGRVKDGPAAAELVCDHGTLAPGASVTVAVVLHLDEGWHAYWVNPGDAGQPPEVAWTLPDGYEVGSLAWPAPHRLVEGPLTTFVHEGELLLPATLHVPEDAAVGEATIGATVTWLACRAQCLPGRAEVAIVRPVRASAPTPDPAAHRRIAQARERLPVPVEARVEREADRLTLEVVGVEGTPTELFPEAEGVFDLGALGEAWTPRGAGVHTTTLTLLDAGMVPERLVGVVVTAAPRKAYAVDVPVAGGTSPESGEPSEEEASGPSGVVLVALTVLGLALLFFLATAVLRSGRRNQT